MTANAPTGCGSLTRVDYDPFSDGPLQRVVPTTEPQREVWLAAKLDREASLAYNESVSLRLRGALDVERLQWAMARVVERHDALRSSIGPDGESFCVLEPQPFAPAFEDLSALSPPSREAAVQAYRDRAVETVFVLEQGRLFRAELLRLQADDHLLLMHAHHIVCDGWSWWVIVRELGAMYRDPRAVLPPAASFADYALAGAAHPRGQTHADDERYWLSRFAGELPVLELPLDRPRPLRRTTASAREDHMLDAVMTAGLRKLGARKGASLFATLLNGFAALMSRVSGQECVVIGIPAAGQAVDGHEDLVGHCVNLLPLRFELDHARSFADALEAAQETLLDALDHQRYTFGTLLTQLRVPRDPSRTPLVSVLFNIDQALDPAKTGFQDLQVDFTTNPRSHDNFELSVNAVQVGGGVRLECQYNRDLFDAATVRRWLAAYETLLRAAVDMPEAPMAGLSLVDGPALAELVALQPAPVAFDRHCLMHEHFERQCDATPDRIAARHEDAALSYRQLDARANRIARLLRRHGVGRGALVGLAVDRGLDMLAAMLGILKAGAGYLPLDPAFPQERLAYMADDAGVAALLTQSGHADRFDLRGRPVLSLDTLESALAAEHDGRLGRDVHAAEPESTAYVIYTSGSTGKPKGVLLPHRAVANLIASMQRWPGIDPDDRLLAVTTLSFDISVVEMVLPLSVGAQVVIVGKEVAGDGRALASLLETSRATVMQATPATWRLLLEAGWKGSPALKIFCGGEPMQPDLATALLARSGQLWNLYGPTETTVYSTGMRVLPAEDGQHGPVIHIGRPLDNTQVWIMDAQGQLCPYGASGEICIGGEGVALSYLDRPELTAERFIPDTLAASMPGFGTGIVSPTLYRTGDRGRWRQDGNIEHQGRLDFQVKVRGYRIELGEIENTLAAHPALTRAVAMAREDRAGDVRLVAYFVPHPGVDVQDAALAAHLRLTLPDYMVPQHFVRLAAIPLLPNGKVNRKELPAPGAMQARPVAGAEDAVDGPRDPLEERVRGVMADILGCAELGMQSNFFEAGGHSLLAAQLCARLGRELDTLVPLRRLFDAPNPRQLAEALRADLAGATADKSTQALTVPHRADQSTAPMTLMQQRLWVIDQMEPDSIIYNAPSAHRLHGPMDVQALERAFREMVRRQASLRTVLVSQGETAVQQVLDEVDTPLLPPTDLSHLPEPQRMAALMDELEAMTSRPFALDQAPLFRVRLFKLGEDDHVLYFMPHHVIWDGWSFDLFYTEMSALYQVFAEGLSSPLPPLDVTYGDYAAWHSQRLQGDALHDQVRYWVDQLSGEREPLHLPEDKPRPAKASGIGGTGWVHVNAATTDALRQIGGRAGATLFMTLLAAYYVLLHRLSGQDDLVVGMPFRNRPSEALEKVMGFFVNMLPLRRRLDPSMPFLRLVHDVRASLVEAFEHPDVPFEHLVRELKVPRDPARSPIYQALFSFQDVRARQLHWGDLRHEHLLMFQKGAGQDLGIWFLEHTQGLSGAMGYNADVFSGAAARAIGDRFGALLQSLCRDPEQAIGDANMLSAHDRSELARWNSTATPLPASVTAHAVLSAQASRAPLRTALRSGDTAWTYAHLLARSRRIACALAARDVVPGDRVGICLDRGPDMVASMLAVWLAGAAYVPLDPAYPADRLRFMANDARLRVVVGESEAVAPLQLPRERLVLLDTDGAAIEAAAELPQIDTATLGDGDSVAYVIYTSGSTGSPKGVCVPHRAVVNFLDTMAREPGLGADDRLLAVTTTSFDIAVLELFLPLTVGAEVVIASREEALDGVALARLIDSRGITALQATPSTWRLLIEAGWSGAPRLKALCGGEPLPQDLATALLSRCATLWNMYGPTETTVWSTCARIENSAVGAPDIHIGTPIANTTVWVVDARGQPCPPGVVGELCIGGDGVTHGYLERPELTAERFVPDRFVTGKPGSPRLYRTGDRGRWRLDGVLEHLGRLDHQVKIRGYRIELGEIEARLTADESVARALAIVREDRPGDVRLVAYVVTAPGRQIDEAALMAGLRAVLPGYMVPQHVVVLPAIPLLPNGKVDRKALPPPPQASLALPATAAGAGAPSKSKPAPGDQEDPRVSYMVLVWSEILAVPAAAQDNFFDLGGHSMLAVQMANRVARDTGFRIKLMPLATQTLEQIAMTLPASQPAASNSGTGWGRSVFNKITRLLGRSGRSH